MVCKLNEGFCNISQVESKSNVRAMCPYFKKKGAEALKLLCLSLGSCATRRSGWSKDPLDSDLEIQCILGTLWLWAQL